MATQKQILANRANALKGGVKTAAGKAVSRLNAVSHGIFSNEVILPGEDSSLLESVRDNFMQQYAPAGEMETILVERIITCAWRLKRVIRSDARLSIKYLLKDDDAEPNGGIDYRYTSWQNMVKYETSIERALYRALHELERIQRLRIATETNNPQVQELAEESICETPDAQPQTASQPQFPSPAPKPQPQPAGQSHSPQNGKFYETNPISFADFAGGRPQNEGSFYLPPIKNQKAAS